MDCVEVQELLSEYIDDALESSLNEKIKEHLDTCDECRREYELLRKVIDECSCIYDEDLPDGFHERIRSAVSEQAAMHKSNAYSRARKYYKPAAALMVLALALGLIINSGLLGFGSKTTKTSNSSIARNGRSTGSASSMKAPESYDMSSNLPAAAQYDSAMVNLVSINLSTAEYKKYDSRMASMIESLGGVAVYENPAAYMMPGSKKDALVKWLESEVGSSSISFSNVQSDLQELEGSNGSVSGGSSLDRKEHELYLLNNNSGSMIVEVNVVN